ncbi:nickel pincer cofactor biosynthesis protein LarC [Clostridium merdae]|uniref:nickel pincer cofactor biosynthesis protein LarC n=1 Tax=Clostridium merdae TaxID=1958780 RepID=UPI000A26D188|nr:nickel pincer cofactor biosynthesis protein LarC [Clostridium merdae]
MKTLYMDCFSGISGNMTIGAFLDLGVDQAYLLQELDKLQVDGYKIEITKKQKNGITGTYFDVILQEESEHSHQHENTSKREQHAEKNEKALPPCTCKHHRTYCICGKNKLPKELGSKKKKHKNKNKKYAEHAIHFHADSGFHSHETHSGHHHHDHGEHGHAPHRNLQDITQIIDASELSDNVKQLSKKMFSFVAEAEAKVHGKPIEEVHFHEVGAIDSIIDIVGTAICVDFIKPDRIVASHLPVGSGFVRCQHGLIPVPAPATLEIIRKGGIPTYSNGIQKELATPTGAAILAALAQEYGSQPEMEIQAVGYGAGLYDLEIPNTLRLMMGEVLPVKKKKKKLLPAIILAETNVDDTTGEILGYVMSRLLDAGALDVFFTPIYMKKCRPAFTLSFLCEEALLPELETIVFEETSTIGIRSIPVQRTVMNRKSETVHTRYGAIRVKKATYGNITKTSGEFEDVKAAAQQNGVPIQTIYNALHSNENE